MSGPAFRFLHTGDWHLHQVCHGLGEIPEPLCNLLIDAPYEAAQKVFDVAVAEQVNFVVLCGDILHPLEAGPRGVAFLVQQFERLEQQGIAVYWAGGRCDPPERWPPGAALPNNVSVFPKGRVEEIAHFVGQEHAATIVGRSYSGSSRVDPADFVDDQPRHDEFRLAVAYGDVPDEALAAYALSYWAVGGTRQPRTLFEHPQHAAVMAGTPQGRSPAEPDAHGCVLVQVDAERHMQIQQIATDVLRWRHERIPLPDNASLKEIERRLRERGQQLAVESADRPLMVTWKLDVQGKLAAVLRHGGWAEQLRKSLNQTLGSGAPCLWTVAIDVPLHGDLPTYWYDEDTILGDFLRAVRQFQGEKQPLRLQEFVGRRELEPALHDLLLVSDQDERAALLREVALLGSELLRGEG